MKKILLLLLTLTLVFTSTLFVSSCGGDKKSSKEELKASEGLEYILLDDDTYAVTGIGSFTGTDLVIPSTYNGKPVTSIGDYAFENCTSLISVTIPSSVTSISYGAFLGCTSLTSIIIPDSVTSIDRCAFMGSYTHTDCSSLEYNTYDNAYYLGNDDNPYLWLIKATDTSITSCTINSNTKFIYTNAFSGCSSLENIYYTGDINSWVQISGLFNLPNVSLYINDTLLTDITEVNITTATSINEYAFYNFDKLTKVTIGDQVLSIGNYAFYKCSSLEYNTYDNAYYLGNDNNPYLLLVEAINTSITSCTINSNTKFIHSGAFSDCSSLTSITIPDNVTSIGNGAFYNCNSLTSVTIPNNVISIGDYAFYDCSSLTSITIPNKITSIGNWAFSGCSRLTSITIPDNVTRIGNYAFEGCDSLENIYISDINSWVQISDLYYLMGYGYGKSSKNLYINGTLLTEANITTATSINGYAFCYCTSLTKVTIGNQVTSIGYSAFRYCYSLTSITIGNSVTSIGSGAFSDCSKLTSIIIPDSVTSIGESAFSGCSSLEYNTYDNAYYLGNDNNPYLWLIEATDTSITSCTINPNTKFIHSGAFYNCTSLTSITIPDSVTSIDYFAFSDCSSLTSVTIGNGVTSICDYAFKDCSSLTSITIGNKVTSIGGSAFEDCDSLENIYISDINSWVQISGLFNLMWYNGKSPKNLYINGTLLTEANITTATSINSYAFYKYDKLTKVTIGDQVTNIGRQAFYKCSSLENIYYTGDINSWVQISGLGNLPNVNLYINDTLSTNLTEVNITTATSISDCAFIGCTSLTKVTIGNQVTSIGRGAFYGCSKLTSIIIPDSVTSIGESAFSDCSSLTSVTFENTSGWYVTEDYSATSGTNVDVTDSSQNATYLTDTYCYYCWKRS